MKRKRYGPSHTCGKWASLTNSTRKLVKHEVRRRVSRSPRGATIRRCNRAYRDTAVDADGNLRRPDTLHREVWHRRAAAGRSYAGAWARVPGVCYAAGVDRQGATNCSATQYDFLLLRRYAPRARLLRRSIQRES